MSARSAEAVMISVYDGRTCLGFVLSRGCKGFEAFDAEERSLAVSPTQRDAANAVITEIPSDDGMRADAPSSADQTTKDQNHE